MPPSPLAVLVARLLRSPVSRWRRYWDVDHRSGHFLSDAEAEALRVERGEQWKSAVRGLSLDFAASSVLPRLRTTGARLSLAPHAAPLHGDLHSTNPLAFHLLHALPLLLGLGAAWAGLHALSSRVDHVKLRAFTEQRTTMSKRRFEQLREATLGTGGGEAGADGAAVSSTPSGEAAASRGQSGEAAASRGQSGEASASSAHSGEAAASSAHSKAASSAQEAGARAAAGDEMESKLARLEARLAQLEAVAVAGAPQAVVGRAPFQGGDAGGGGLSL
jgi:hypothetical protein